MFWQLDTLIGEKSAPLNVYGKRRTGLKGKALNVPFSICSNPGDYWTEGGSSKGGTTPQDQNQLTIRISDKSHTLWRTNTHFQKKKRERTSAHGNFTRLTEVETLHNTCPRYIMPQTASPLHYEGTVNDPQIHRQPHPYDDSSLWLKN